MGGKTTTTRRGGRPSLSLEQRRSERISFGVTKTQKAAFLTNAAQAGLSSNDFAREILCRDGNASHVVIPRAPDFELIDALSRIGADLARLRAIAEDTGIVREELDAIIARLTYKLDHLIVGSRIADELAEHRAQLIAIGRLLETQSEMTPKARRMITTFDAVVRKVLAA